MYGTGRSNSTEYSGTGQGTPVQIRFPKISGTEDGRGSGVVEGYGSVVGRLALLARRADRATSSNVAKHPLSEAGGGSNSTEYSGTRPTTPPHDAKDASRNFLSRGLPLLARRGSPSIRIVIPETESQLRRV